MRTSTWALPCAFALLSASLLLPPSAPPLGASDSPLLQAHLPSEEPLLRDARPGLGQFTENVGQVRNGAVRYYGDFPGGKVGFTELAVLLLLLDPSDLREPAEPDPDSSPEAAPGVLHQLLVRVDFAGAGPVRPVGREPLPHFTNYFLGKDADAWRTHVRAYREIVYPNLYAGIDLVYRAASGALKYTFLVHPGADPAAITLAYSGVMGGRIDEAGNLVLNTVLGDLQDSAPYAYDGHGRTVSCPFVQSGATTFGFACRSWDRDTLLTVDPQVYSTYVGGSADDVGHGLAVDAGGSAYVVGNTFSFDFPVTPGAFNTSNQGVRDAFVAKLDPRGSSYEFVTYLGGTDDDSAVSVAVDLADRAYVVGATTSSDFPTTPGAFDGSLDGPNDAFVVALDATGSGLVYATLLGGASVDWGSSVAVDAAGNAYLTGGTYSVTFPWTPGAYDTTLSGLYDAFVAKVNVSGSGLVFATYLGGSDLEQGYAIAIDSAGNAYVTGGTGSMNFPTPAGAWDSSLDGGWDAFVTKLNASGSSLDYSTFLGGSRVDLGFSIAVDSAGSAYVTGETEWIDFPVTPGAFNSTYMGGQDDAFITKFDASGSGLAYSTYIGGSGYEHGMAIAVDSSGRAYLTGFSDSTNLPVSADAVKPAYGGGPDDAYLIVLSINGSSLLYGSYVGGNGVDNGRAVVGVSGCAYVAGDTDSTDFETTAGSAQPFPAGGSDAFVAEFSVTAECMIPPPLPPLEPPLITNVTADWTGGSVTVVWSPSPTVSVDYYEVFGGPSQIALDFSAPLYTTPDNTTLSWEDLLRPAVAAEYYYVVRAVDAGTNLRSVTSNTGGYFTASFAAGLDTFSLPLSPFWKANVSWFLGGVPGASVRWMGAGSWNTYRTVGDPDAGAVQGSGYLLEAPVAGTFRFTGEPAAMIRYQDGPCGFDQSSRLLTVTVDPAAGDVSVQWASAECADSYRLLRSDNRRGFFTGIDLMAFDNATSPFVDPAVAQPGTQMYYMVIPVNVTTGKLSGSYSIGIWTAGFSGTSTLGLPLRPLVPSTAAGLCGAVPSCLGVIYLQTGSWIPHFRVMPPAVYDTSLTLARGYQIAVRSTTRHPFVGV